MDKNEFFEEIYVGYHEKIYEFIHCRVCSVVVAEDLTSDVFVAVYKNLHTYDSSKSFISTWLYAIAANRLKNYYKKNSAAVYSIDDMAEKDIVPYPDCPNPMEQEELRIMLDCLMENLPKRSREIICMKYYKNMTSMEIGQNLHISPVNVRVILKRTLGAMKDMLKSVS